MGLAREFLAVNRRRMRRLIASGAAALATVGLALACGSSPSSGELEPGQPGWLVPCSASSECAIGECLCGVCSEPCAAGGADCSAAPAGARCFAPGSVVQAALCGRSAAAGLCLPGCRAGDDCGAGFACALGACVPERSLPASEEPADAVSRAYAEAFPSSWAGMNLLGSADPSSACDDPALCPTLEALLRTDSCFEVLRGCGITYLNAHDAFNESALNYWYGAFEAPPLLAYESGSGTLLGGGAVACDGIEMACWTCDSIPQARPPRFGSASCADVPGVWPGPPPAPAELPECSCEPAESGGARVSLDCFCSIYGCPSQAELLAGCASSDPTPPASAPRVDRAALSNGRLWLSSGRFTGRSYGFDGESGALVGAWASSQGPVTLPCSTASVSAGLAPPSPSSPNEVCFCDGSLPRCGEAAWFPQLP